MFPRRLPSRRRAGFALGLLAPALAVAGLAAAQTAPKAAPKPKATPAAAPAATPTPSPVDGGWPREVKTSAGIVTVYQPQLDAWDGAKLSFYAAFALRDAPDAQPLYGVVWGDGRTVVDKDTRLVTFTDRTIRKLALPSAPEKEKALLDVVNKEVAPVTRTIALDRLAAMLEVAEADKAARTLTLKNDPPRIVFSYKSAILVTIDGPPVWRKVKDSKLERVINTRVLLVRKDEDEIFVRVFDGWMTAKSLDGPWTVEKDPPKELKAALEDAKASGQVDLLLGGNPNDAKTLPSLKQQGRSPVILVATAPTELIVIENGANFVAIPGTGLSYVQNTTGNVFRLATDQRVYLLISGRWFRAASFDGPWEYVANDALPPDFAKIPDDSPKENVKAAVSGTPQAKEARIANAIPQVAEVRIAETKIDPPKLDGEPKLAPIEGTSLQYVTNTATPIIQVTPTSYYALQDAVWFAGPSATGPWDVATSVPSAIYTIPPSASLHYVTYVRVYEATPTTVSVGYTSGYYGACVSNDVVVYGTGYTYPPYVGTVWYGPPMTYGVGVGMTYTPWTGWTFGFGFGWSWGAVTVGWGWGAYPWWGPVGWGYYYPYPYYRPPYWGGAAWGPWGGGAVWGPGGWAATTGNVYSRWGNTSAVTRRSGGYNAWTGNAWRNSAGASYNSRTGTLSAGQRSAVGNVYTGNYAYGARGGSVNTKTGGSVSGGRVTGGNIYTGNQVTAGRISGTTGDGQSGSAGWVRGEQGGVARVGDDLYAGKDGSIYKRNGEGGWDQVQRDGSWQGVQDGQRAGTLDQQQRARSEGAQRTGGYDSSRAGGYGQGYRSGGGYSGAAATPRGGGGRRR
ncbi:MAG TPA: autotransporter [Vicinamibacteria bacterium]|nr:autotransporter [Vicinamibacteria bacterium]